MQKSFLNAVALSVAFVVGIGGLSGRTTTSGSAPAKTAERTAVTNVQIK